MGFRKKPRSGVIILPFVSPPDVFLVAALLLEPHLTVGGQAAILTTFLFAWRNSFDDRFRAAIVSRR